MRRGCNMTADPRGRAGAIVAFAMALATLGPAHTEITEVRLGAPEPFVEGKSFGAVGPYVRIRGVAKGELDPNNAGNRVIVNLDKAPRNAGGRVEYETDVYI